MNKVLLRLLYWLLLPASWIATVLSKRLLRSVDIEEAAKTCYEDGMISAEQHEAVKMGEIDLYDAMRKRYTGRKIVMDDAGDIRGEKAR